MAGRDKTKTGGEPGKAQTGRKKRMNLRIGGPGILVGALAVAFVVGAAIRIRRYRSLQKAKKRLQCSSRDYSNGGLRSILQADRHGPRYSVDGTSEMIWESEEKAQEDSSEYEIQIEKTGENEGDETFDTDHGEWKTKDISESNAEEEHSADEAEGEEKYDDAEDLFADSEAEGENDVTDDEYEDEDEAEDDGECVVEKCEEGSQGTEESSMESNAEVVWPEEMKEWPLEIKEMKISHYKDRIAKSYNFLNETERRIPVKIKLRIWIWTTLMLLLLLLLSVTNHKSYVSSSY
ncbi:hypothetical protein PVL29_008667 [Vitis rotundifolia]|uniref:Uncharacterized protein n=1 Tax=Vitis rotundifolia TaxID=103349 RepID=A0AA39DTN9_VITRO|nr:hypothetical protein PVL29_008667 [Vitis rotundifolia]